MVTVAVGDQHMGRAADRFGAPVFGNHRVAGHPGVDEDNGVLDLDPEARMAEPGDFHVFPPRYLYENLAMGTGSGHAWIGFLRSTSIASGRIFPTGPNRSTR